MENQKLNKVAHFCAMVLDRKYRNTFLLKKYTRALKEEQSLTNQIWGEMSVFPAAYPGATECNADALKASQRRSERLILAIENLTKKAAA